MALRPRHLRRYRQIAEVLTKHGFGAIVHQLGLDHYLDLPDRLLRRKPSEKETITPAHRVALALEELGPTFVKLGQILSTRSDLLPPSFVDELSRLQDDVAPASWDTVKSIIQKELGQSIDEVFAEFDEIPIAAASLAQVHAAILLNGDEVVIKVQRPDIQPVIETDLDILKDMAQLAQDRLSLAKRYQVADLADEFSSALRTELDYRRESRNADRFRANFEDEPHIYVPKIYWEHTTRHVMVMERISGIKINDINALDAAGHDRHQLALHSARFIIQEVFEDGFFHADPHPGNLLVMPGEVIGVLDFGTVGHLSATDRTNLVRLFVNVIQMDAEGVVDQLIRMEIANHDADEAALRRDLRRLMMRYQGVPLEEISVNEILEGLEPIIYNHNLHIPTDLWLLIKTVVIMEGVGRRLDPEFDIFDVARPYIRRLMFQLWMPSELGLSALRTVTTLSDLVFDLPRLTARILGQVERGDLGLQVYIPQLDNIIRQVQTIANRIIMGVLLAALVLGLSLLIPNLDLTWPWNIFTWIIIAAFVTTLFLALWLIWSILRTGGTSK
jgi:ubiquinone biosynthesis protein